MMVLAALAVGGLFSGADRLEYGSTWHCASIGSSDGYTLDFLIEHSNGQTPPKQMRVIKASADIQVGITGFGTDRADKNDMYDAAKDKTDPYYPVSEYTQGFYNFGVDAMTLWKSRSDDVELDLRVFNYEFRDDPLRRAEKVYALNCLRTDV